MSVYNNLNPSDLFPIPTPKIFPGPQQVPAAMAPPFKPHQLEILKKSLGAIKNTTGSMRQVSSTLPQPPKELVEKAKTLGIFFKITPDHKEILRNISDTTVLEQLEGILGPSLKYLISRTAKANDVSILIALLINKIAGDIFDIREEAVERYSIHQDQIAELVALKQNNYDGKVPDGRIQRHIYRIIEKKLLNVTPEQARQLNIYLKKHPFDFASSKSYAEQEADKAIKHFQERKKTFSDLTTHSRKTKRGNKRKPSILTPSPEDIAGASRSKRRRTATAQPPLSLNQSSFRENPQEQVFNAQSTLTQEFDMPELGFTSTNETYQTVNPSPEEWFSSSPMMDSSLSSGIGIVSNSVDEIVDWTHWSYDLNL